jgi:hypothetical protein
MKKLSIVLFAMFFIACQSPKFVVLTKKSTGVLDNCFITVKPINDKAVKISKTMDGILIGCDDYQINDTLVLTKKEFTNF